MTHGNGATAWPREDLERWEDRGVTAESAHERDPEDPVAILGVLPGRHHEPPANGRPGDGRG